jgi:hypothetical protein
MYVRVQNKNLNSRMLPSKLPRQIKIKNITSISFSTQHHAATIVQGPALLTQTGTHRPQPSLFLLPGLRSLPFWTAPPNSNSRVSVAYGDPVLISIVHHLEQNFDIIREEYLRGVMGIGRDIANPKPLESDYDLKTSGGEHAATSLHVGTWDWHSFISGGVLQPRFETVFPKTASIIRLLRTPQYSSSLFDTMMERQDTSTGSNPFAYCFFSTLQGNSRIKAHTGPMNLRLRIHFPLIVPKITIPDASCNKPHIPCGIRVGDQIRAWEEGKVLILDDSYEHEVWNDTNDVRVLLLIDIWHPDVRNEEKHKIGAMFQFARQQGWMRP